MNVEVNLDISAKFEVCEVSGRAEFNQGLCFRLAPLVGHSWDFFGIFDI